MQAFFKPKVPKNPQKMDIQIPAKQHFLPWVQKYRPNKLTELASQQQVVRAFSGIAKTGELPHLLLFGPAGTGKTSSVIALAKQLYGPHIYRERVLELNASDDRGITVVREKIKKFAMNAISKNVDKNYLCPNYKIIILDEADSMTNDAQSALRRIIQDFSARTRFIIICNYITKIIEPLASRCIKFRFKPIPIDQQLTKLEEICVKQNIKISKEVVVALLSQGDLRKSINSLQSLHNVNTIAEVLPMPQSVCTELFEVLKFSNNLQEVLRVIRKILSDGWPFDELLKGLLKETLQLKDPIKTAMIFEVLAKADEGINLNGSELQIIEAVSNIFYVLHSKQDA